MEFIVKKPTTRTALKSFNKLVAAAETVIYDKGYFNCTINDIVAEADLGTGTFYIYFDSKYTMYVYLMQKYEHELKVSLAKSIKDCTTRLETEIEGIRAFISHAIENPKCYNLIWESLYVNRELFLNYYKSFADSYVKGLQKSADEIRPEIDLETLAYSLIGISNFVGLQAISREGITEERLHSIIETIRVILKTGVFLNGNN